MLQKSVPVLPGDTVGSVYFNHLFPLGVQAMLEAADLVVAGRHTEIPQDEAQASYEGWCKDPEARINWHAHVDATYNLIRGCNPSPGAWTTISGVKTRIYEAALHPVRRLADVIGKPGEVVAIGEHGVEVCVQGGRIEIQKLRAEGGEKMSAAAYAAASGMVVGQRLGIDPTPAGGRQPAATAEDPRRGLTHQLQRLRQHLQQLLAELRVDMEDAIRAGCAARFSQAWSVPRCTTTSPARSVTSLSSSTSTISPAITTT